MYYKGTYDDLTIIGFAPTEKCKNKCVYCKQTSEYNFYENELTTQECFEFFDDISKHFSPMICFTGGDPMERKDIYALVEYGSKLGLSMSMGIAGPNATEENLRRLHGSGLGVLCIPIQGATKEKHELIVGREGSFDESMSAIDIAQKLGFLFAFTTTLTKLNYEDIPFIVEIAKKVGAFSDRLFFYVDLGRGNGRNDLDLTPRQTAKILKYIYEVNQSDNSFDITPYCAPYYGRIVAQQDEKGGWVRDDPLFPAKFGMCCAKGKGFIYVSHTGNVQPCGMFAIKCGNIREEPLSRIYHKSRILQELRDERNYKGKCGICNYNEFCGGCRGRAYLETGDYLAEDPLCFFGGKESKSKQKEVKVVKETVLQVGQKPQRNFSNTFYNQCK